MKKNIKKLVKMAAQDGVDVCESWEDMDEIGVSWKLLIITVNNSPSARCLLTN
jgi:hypothetical protein